MRINAGKFQGQEAPIVNISMCASEASESPRGIDFLFSKNRLNVAISRAQALAVIVGSPQLGTTPVNNLRQMELVIFSPKPSGLEPDTGP
jgi:superfamily I DNA and/or RNA helicase